MQKISSIIIITLLLLIPAAAMGADRIMQGDEVYLGEHYDVTGVSGWPNAVGDYYIAWYNGFLPEKGVKPYILKLPSKSYVARPSQYDFFIDPVVFGDRLGEWHQYYYSADDGTHEIEEHGNTLAFVVARTRAVNTTPVGNVTITNQTPDRFKPVIPVEPKHIADFVVARGDSFNITVNQTAKLWLFGRIDGRYDIQSTNGFVYIPAEDLSLMEPGTYTMLVQTMRPTLETFTVRYNPNTYELDIFHPQTFSISHIPLYGLSPKVAVDRVKSLYATSSDGFQEFTFSLQDPMVEIITIDSITETDTVQLLDIRGYTNVAKGTNLTLVFDEDLQTARTIDRFTFTTETKEVMPGDMRYFQTTIPIYLYQLFPGDHYVTITTPIGGHQKVPYFIYEEPAPHYIPNDTIRYVGGDEFRPPVFVNTTVTVTVEVPKPYPVPPSQESVNTAQAKAFNENWWKNTIIIVGVICCIAGGIYLSRYLKTVWRRM